MGAGVRHVRRHAVGYVAMVAAAAALAGTAIGAREQPRVLTDPQVVSKTWNVEENAARVLKFRAPSRSLILNLSLGWKLEEGSQVDAGPIQVKYRANRRGFPVVAVIRVRNDSSGTRKLEGQAIVSQWDTIGR